MNKQLSTVRCTCSPLRGLACVVCYKPHYDMLNEVSKPVVAAPPLVHVAIGVTMTNGTTLEIMSDDTAQVRIRGTSHVINLGPVAIAMSAMLEAVNRLSIHT